MYCTKCGAANDDDSRFCTSCGAPLERPEEPAAMTPAGGARQIVPRADDEPTKAMPPVGRPADGTVPDGMTSDGSAPNGPVRGGSAPNGPVRNGPTANGPSSYGSASNGMAPGNPVRSNPAQPGPTPNTPAPVRGFGASGGASNGLGTNGTAKTVDFTDRRLPAIIAIVVAAFVLIAGIIGFVTYRAELWGGKTLPDPASIASQVSAKQHGGSNGKAAAPTAKAVAKALEAKGLATTTTREFSGMSKGTFLGYVGAKAGERVRTGVTVTLRESAGPGVPKNTVGKQAEKTVSTFKDMGVPVHYKKIIVNDTKKTPEGTIVATYPAAGQSAGAGTDADDGIYLGVATKGDGIGADIIGGDKDTVRNQLESKGYKVTLAPRFASKSRVGKITGSDPAPGSPVSSGASVTLYYGIDASGVKEAYTIHDSPETGMPSNMLGTSSVAAGTWCRNDGDCITFDSEGNPGQWLDTGSIPYSKGRDGQDYGEYGSLVSCDAVQQPYCSDSKADYLLTQDYGAFELMPQESLTDMWCGDERVNMNGAFGGACVNGVMDENSMSTTYSGATYRMQDYFVVVPVGSDLKGLESKGFFDKDALATAKKGKDVDTDRPFLLYRDPKLYDKTSVPVTDVNETVNPFLPYNGYSGSKSDIVKMKPAPSDASAYYLVEQGGDYDWSSLDDAEVKGTDGGTLSGGADGGGESGAAADNSDSAKSMKTYTADEVRTAVGKGDFTPIAGTYCLKSGKGCVTLSKDGTVAAQSGDKPLMYSHPTKLRYQTGGWDKYVDGDAPFLDLIGPDDDYQCTTADGAEHSGAFCASDDYFDQGGYEAGISQRPINPLYIFKGATFDVSSGNTPFDPGQGVMSFTADKPCLYFMGYHMNPAPTEDTAYWLQ